MKPKVSVIIPVYNVGKYLRECLDSMVNQTLQDIEIICINNGSQDNSLEILQEYAVGDKRILIIDRPHGGGYGSSCNVGLDKAGGEYVAIFEPDDFIALGMYEKLYNLALKHDADIVKSGFCENIDTACVKRIKPVKSYGENSLFAMPTSVFTIFEHPEFLSFHPSIWSCIYRLEFIKKYNIRFVEVKDTGWADNPFQVQTMCLAQRIFYTDERFYYWRKTYLTDSDALKDYTIPFKRSDEIHQWLDKNKITDKNLLACLYKREFAYIKIVFGMLSIRNLHKGFRLIRLMLDRMDTDIISSNKFITKKERTNFAILKISMLPVYFLNKVKTFRKKLIRHCGQRS